MLGYARPLLLIWLRVLGIPFGGVAQIQPFLNMLLVPEKHGREAESQ